MQHLYQIEINVFNAILQVLFGEPEECAKEMRDCNISETVIKDWLNAIEERKEYLGEYYGKCYGKCYGMFLHNDEENFTMLWLRDVPVTIENYGSLVHEIEHYVFYLLDRIGMKHTKASDEAYAYLTAHVFKEIDNIIVTKREENEKQE